jgi:hypothetical protein
MDKIGEGGQLEEGKISQRLGYHSDHSSQKRAHISVNAHARTPSEPTKDAPGSPPLSTR